MKDWKLFLFYLGFLLLGFSLVAMSLPEGLIDDVRTICIILTAVALVSGGLLFIVAGVCLKRGKRNKLVKSIVELDAYDSLSCEVKKMMPGFMVIIGIIPISVAAIGICILRM